MGSSDPPVLPPGQREHPSFPRFGHTAFADRFPAQPDRVQLVIDGELRRPPQLGIEWATLPRHEQTSGFHCVTTWSRRGLRWGGVRFSELWQWLAQQQAGVALEERGQGLPGWLLRRLYRPLIGPTARRFAQALARHEDAASPRTDPARGARR